MPKAWALSWVFFFKCVQTLVEEMWYVEEKDLLALALNGSMSFHKFNLTCLHPDWTGTV